MRYQINHRTAYRYHGVVSSSYSEAHLVPRSLGDQTCTHHEIVVHPRPTDYRERDDFFGNRASYFSIQEPHTDLSVTATSVVEVGVRAGQLSLGSAEGWETAVGRVHRSDDAESIAARPYVLDSPLVTASDPLRAYGEASFTPGRPLVECVADLSSRIHRDFEYRPGATTISTKLDDVLASRTGVCQDFAHLAIGCTRAMGVAARYVSGYLETIAPAGKPKLRGVDASHAWFAVFVPGAGWMDMDPTNDRITNERYITTAWGRDYADVTPLKGVVFSAGSDQDLEVSVDVVALGV